MDEHEFITLELNREDAPELIDIIRQLKGSVDEDINRKQSELKVLISKSARLGLQLERLTGGGQRDDNATAIVGIPRPIARQINGYKANWSVWDKVKYILKKEIQPVTKRQIIEKIEAFDPVAASLIGKKKRQFSVSISSCLTTKSDKEQLIRIVEPGKENKYRLPNLEEE